MATYVLVPGGGHGGWCYQRVARLLEADGHVVYCPTLTGLGDRLQHVGLDTDLRTHVTDIAKLLFYEDLNDVVLVGHSYGGVVIKGVADQLSERLAALVYLDAPEIESGQRVIDVSPMLIEARKSSQVVDGVELFGFPDEGMVRAYGISDPGDVAWTLERLTPHPWKCVEQPLVLNNEPAINALPLYRIVATDFPLIERDPDVMSAASADGRVWEITGGHDLMIIEPEAVAKSLTEIAAVAVRPALRPLVS